MKPEYGYKILGEFAIEAAIAFYRLKRSMEDMIEREVGEDAVRGVEQIKKLLKSND